MTYFLNNEESGPTGRCTLPPRAPQPDPRRPGPSAGGESRRAAAGPGRPSFQKPRGSTNFPLSCVLLCCFVLSLPLFSLSLTLRSLSLSLSLSSLSLSPECIYTYAHIYMYVNICVNIYTSLYIYPSISLSFSLAMSVSLSLSLSLPFGLVDEPSQPTPSPFAWAHLGYKD